MYTKTDVFVDMIIIRCLALTLFKINNLSLISDAISISSIAHFEIRYRRKSFSTFLLHIE